MGGKIKMPDWIGRTLSKVTIQKLLGRGGMAEVYMGLHNTLKRSVAVKILHGHLLEDDALMDRFRSEAQAVASLRHPNIIQVFDFDIVEDQPYIVMELLEGPSLADYLGALRRRGKILPHETTGRLITAIAGALDYAHARGIVHRDVKPANILLRAESGPIDLNGALPDDVQPVLTDFGIARLANATIRTASGAIVGTPAYMSPEQVTGTTVDARSDIYSLGVVLYELLSSRLPFETGEEETVASALVKHITEAPQPLPEVPANIQAIVFRALAKDRDARYVKTSEMALELRQVLGQPLATRELDMLRASVLTKTPILNQSTLKLPQARARTTRALWTIGLIAALTVLIGLGVLFGTGVLGDDDNNKAAAPGNFGTLSFGSASGRTVDQITLVVDNLAPPPEGMHYEAWLLGIETRRDIGVLDLDENGNGEITFVVEQEENLLSAYDQFEITLEPSPDPNPLPTGNALYSGLVPAGPLAHIRHLVTAFGRTPDGQGLVINLLDEADLIVAATQALLEAQQDGDLEEIKRQAEGIVNVIEGSGGEHFGDLDGDGETTNPGDGFGLLPGSQGAGYIQSSIEHARFATGAPDTNESVNVNAGHLEVAAQNLGGWAAQLRDSALAIIASEDMAAAEEHVQKAAELAELFIKGQDVNGSETIEPIRNEGGAETVFYYAQRMADMTVRENEGVSPESEPTPDATPHDPAGMERYEEEGY
jgi:serine/threonine protein kinase